MTTLIIPAAVLDGIEAGTCTASVTLVDGADRALIGLRTTDGAPVTARAEAVLTEAGEDWEVELTPQAQIAVPGGAATYYRVHLSTDLARAAWRVQVPESPATVALLDLVDAAALEPPTADLMARLLTVAERAAFDAALVPLGADNPVASLADVGDSAGVSTDVGQLLVIGTDSKPLATAAEITPEAIGAAPAAAVGVSLDFGQLLIAGTDGKPLATAAEITPEAIGAAPAAAVATGWDDLRAPATVIPLQGQSGDPDRDTDGSLLFDAAAIEQIAILFQMPHPWTGTGIRLHVHWCKSSNAVGDVIWEARHRVWGTGQVAPAWSDWTTPAGRSDPVASDQRQLIDYWAEIDMTGLGASSMVSVQIRRAATNASNTYAADARLWEADIHYQSAGFGTLTEYGA
jgi:hypothetical protein